MLFYTNVLTLVNHFIMNNIISIPVKLDDLNILNSSPTSNPEIENKDTACINCRWCHQHTKHEQIISLPLLSDSYTNKFLTAFCSYECAAAFNQYNNEYCQDKNNTYAELCNQYNKEYGYERKPIKLAPSPSFLKCFGGNMTYEEYNKFKTQPKNVYRYTYPINSAMGYVLETSNKEISGFLNQPSLYNTEQLNKFSNILKCKRKINNSII